MNAEVSSLPSPPATDAALRLHDPALSAPAVVTLLVRLVTDHGLAPEATFVPTRNRSAMGYDGPHADGRELHLPVGAPGKEAEGVLVLRPVDAAAARQAHVLVAHAGAALAAVRRVDEIARREDSVRRVAEQLQDALLPAVPEVAHSTIEVRYRAAGRDARVGGDFYDVFELPDGRVMIVVGDVVGKGVEAAVRTSRITQTMRALALQGLTLETLLERGDEHVTFQDPEMMATVWCGMYEPDSGELEFASLGHPPALLLREREDTAIRLELQGLPLGMRDLTDEAPECRSRRLETGDLLVLYTDGVVEAARDFIAGQEALLAAIEARRQEPAGQMVDGALDELLADADHLDDALMLVVRRR